MRDVTDSIVIHIYQSCIAFFPVHFYSLEKVCKSSADEEAQLSSQLSK